MAQFLQHIFPTPIFSGNSDNLAIRARVCELACRFRDSAVNAGLVSEKWDQAAKSSRREDFDECGVTSFYSTNLLMEPAWQEVSQFIRHFAATMIATAYQGNDLALLNMWTTIYPQGAYVPSHVHSNAHLSGVFYARAAENCGNLVFTDPAMVAKTMHSRSTNPFPTPATKWVQGVREGDMVIFPAWLPHETRANRSGQDRIIVSFNIGLAEPPAVHA